MYINTEYSLSNVYSIIIYKAWFAAYILGFQTWGIIEFKGMQKKLAINNVHFMKGLCIRSRFSIIYSNVK